MAPSSNDHAWFAVRVRPRYEKIVETNLVGKGYEVFLPFYRCVRRWSQRFKTLELPLFPGYLFCRFCVQARLPVLVTPSVIQIVGIGKTPYPVEDNEIAALQTIVASGLRADPVPYMQIGQRVCIQAGALAGVEGILIGWKGRSRILVSVNLLQRSVAVDIDMNWVQPIRPVTSSRVPDASKFRMIQTVDAP